MEIFVFLFGVVFGSFANVLIDRGDDLSVLTGRSRCDFCRKKLLWYELIPILSFVFLGGRCRTCKKKLSVQYPIVELIMGFSFVSAFLFLHLPSDISLVFSLLLVFSFVVIFMSDFKYFIIPDSMIILSIASGVAIFLLSHSSVFYSGSGVYAAERIFDRSIPYIGSGFLVGSFFFLLWLITRGKGMGFGDVKLAFVIGLLLGFPKATIALYAAFLTGALYGVILILGRKKNLKSIVPFGPFLILGLCISIVFGEKILEVWKTFW